MNTRRGRGDERDAGWLRDWLRADAADFLVGDGSGLPLLGFA